MRRPARFTRFVALLAGALALTLAMLAVLGSAPVTARPPRSASTPAGPAPATAAVARLAETLLPRLGPVTANAVDSPLSIETALAMVDQGARGSTAEQIAHVLGDRGSPASLAAANRALASLLVSSGKDAPSLATANGIWVQHGFPVRRAFSSRLTEDFDAASQAADFASDPSAATQQIDAWVADHTAGRIGDLFPAGALSAQTRLVLVDAIILKARWARPFDKSLTADQAFHPARGKSIRVPFMTFADPVALPYADTGAEEAVELPYRDSRLSLLVVMPPPGGVARFEASPTALSRAISALHTDEVEVELPRLSLSLDTGLNGVLSALGMPVAFSRAADFAGISPVPLRITVVRHAARLQVDEAGTIAAAATGIGTAPTAVAGNPPPTLSFNRPFLLYLRDRATGTILFEARVADPAAG